MLTRVQISEKYRISQATFNGVRHLLVAVEQSKHGRTFFNIGDRDDFVLRCARNHIASFGLEVSNHTRVLPFHRFLCLKFLTTPHDEAITEIYQRNLTTPKFGVDYYKHLERKFVLRAPKELKDLVRKRGVPTKKQRGMYEMLLNVIGVITPYNLPDWMDNLFTELVDPRAKTILETVLTTRGSRADHQIGLEDLSRRQWRNVALDLYTSVFYDIGSLSEEDWRYYLSIILPSEKQSKILAKRMTTGELRVKEGLNAYYQETLQVVAVDLQRRICATMALKGDAFKQIHQIINTYTNIGKLTGDVDQPSVTGTYFHNISLVPADGEFKTISAEIKGKVADGRP